MSPAAAGRRAVVLDCDTGTDDAVAIMLAALSPRLDLLGVVATWGNQAVDDVVANTRAVLALLGRADVPVCRGLAGPVAARHPGVPLEPYAEPHRLALPEPAGPAQPPLPAVDWLAGLLGGTSGGLPRQPITLVATGPLSTVAALVAAHPWVVGAVAELVVLGGAHAVGNVTPSADRNFWNDPPAAAAVLAAPWRRLTLLTVDATYGAALSADQADVLDALGTPAARAAAAFHRERIAHYAHVPAMRARTAAPLHDPLAVAYLLDPGVVELRPVLVQVETEGRLTYGRSVLDLDGLTGRPPNAWVCLRADASRFFEVLLETLA